MSPGWNSMSVAKFSDDVPIDLNRFLLPRRERRHAGQPQNLFDRRSGADGAEITVGETKDRLLVPRRCSRRHFAFMRAVEIAAQNLDQIGPPLATACYRR